MQIGGIEIKRAEKEKTEVKDRDLIRGLDKELEEYRKGLQHVKSEMIEREEWYKSQHWDYIRNQKLKGEPEPVTAYLFNTLFNKHADFMDNFAYPVYLPMDADDKKEAEALSKLIPAVLDRDFKPVYSNNAWEKLKHGTSAYAVLWDSDKDHGIGDLSITDLDVMNCYWLPGINSIYDSPKFFVATAISNEILKLQFPEIDIKRNEGNLDSTQYQSKENVDKSNQSVLVDAYIMELVDVPLDMEPLAEGMEPQTEKKLILRYVKYVGQNLIYDSFNDPEHPDYRYTGYYHDNKYPIIFDVLFPQKDSPLGFGLLNILKSPQLYIDKLDQIILRNAAQAGRIKHLIRKDMGVNIDDLTDTSVDVVEFEGSINEDSYKQYQSKSLAAFVFNHRKVKIDELKDVGTTLDFNRGEAGSGVTAASAIALLQEAGNKTSRDMLDASYEALKEIYALCIERVRQFYNVTKTVRLDSEDPNDPYEFFDYSNAGLQDVVTEENGMTFTRRPYFDIKVVPEKKSPYNQIAHNELAKELFQYGMFRPDMAQAALVAMDMMKFEGKEEVVKRIKQNDMFFKQFQQLAQMVQQLNVENTKMKAIIQDKLKVNMGLDLDQLKGASNDQNQVSNR